ncbi:NADPH2 dehydrogenase [[Emmonsia] crescens]|uniref:NADPH2 dehydrogenase n=1 Tax=[Emmonsia] crescens TaxID=73230 RepID=A0A2B7Z3L8_9EURO|nr:NADPH2 dehydrogenase [Emmonsia crescens]
MVNLQSPIQVGNITLQHRIVLAPLTRYRADDNHVPLPFVKDYYAQRASIPGTLLITEGTFISPRAGGFNNVPGIYNDVQIKAWKEVTDAVHAKGCFIFCQLWALGRAANPQVLAADGYPVVSSSNLPISEKNPVPEPLDEKGIQMFIQDYVQAAKNAIQAGFDGVEIHGANGYLCDQFLQDTCNNRNDRWGGSIENRSRFGIEVATAIVAAIGSEKTAYRVSPWSPFQGMGMTDPRPQFTHLAQNLAKIRLAYLHVVESRINGSQSFEGTHESTDFLVDAFGNSGAVILAGGFSPESATETIANHKDPRIAIAFGRYFIPNPDLPFRILNHIDLTPYNRSTFYNPKSTVGYIDYPNSSQYDAWASTKARVSETPN